MPNGKKIDNREDLLHKYLTIDNIKAILMPIVITRGCEYVREFNGTDEGF